jgi:hypothetical protein
MKIKFYIGHASGTKTIFPHKGPLTVELQAEYPEGISGPYKNKHVAMAQKGGSK